MAAQAVRSGEARSIRAESRARAAIVPDALIESMSLGES